MSVLAGRWRLLAEGAGDGAANMAEDVALLEGDGHLPVLRLFGWRRPTLSLGYSQDAERVVDWEAAGAAGIEVVRRPTGGGAVLHDGALEVTYSVVAPEHGLPAGVVDGYRLIAQALVAALAELGLAAELAQEVVAPRERGPVCFETPSRYELLVGGRKTVGSAQLRRRGRVLQHGSVPLRLDPDRAVLALRGGDKGEWARRLAEHACGLEEAAGRSLGAEAVRAALVAGFASALGARFEPGELTPGERARREELVRLGTFGPLAPGRRGAGGLAAGARPAL